MAQVQTFYKNSAWLIDVPHLQSVFLNLPGNNQIREIHFTQVNDINSNKHFTIEFIDNSKLSFFH